MNALNNERYLIEGAADLSTTIASKLDGKYMEITSTEEGLVFTVSKNYFGSKPWYSQEYKSIEDLRQHESQLGSSWYPTYIG